MEWLGIFCIDARNQHSKHSFTFVRKERRKFVKKVVVDRDTEQVFEKDFVAFASTGRPKKSILLSLTDHIMKRNFFQFFC